MNAVQEMRSSICALLLLDLEERGLLPKKIDRQFWDSWLDSGAMSGPLWLLAYEGTRRNWLKCGQEKAIRDDQIFKALDEHDVSFLNRSASLKPLFRPKDPSVKIDMELLQLDHSSKFSEFEWEFDESVEEYVD